MEGSERIIPGEDRNHRLMKGDIARDTIPGTNVRHSSSWKIPIIQRGIFILSNTSALFLFLRSMFFLLLFHPAPGCIALRWNWPIWPRFPTEQNCISAARRTRRSWHFPRCLADLLFVVNWNSEAAMRGGISLKLWLRYWNATKRWCAREGSFTRRELTRRASAVARLCAWNVHLHVRDACFCVGDVIHISWVGSYKGWQTVFEAAQPVRVSFGDEIERSYLELRSTIDTRWYLPFVSINRHCSVKILCTKSSQVK